MTEEPARPYLIRPRDAFEAVHGKATLLTDTMIAQIMDVIQTAKPSTKEAEETLTAVWRKLMGLWTEDAPYENEGERAA